MIAGDNLSKRAQTAKRPALKTNQQLKTRSNLRRSTRSASAPAGRDAAAGNHQSRPKTKINRIAQGRPDGGVRRHNSILFFTPRISPVCTDRRLVTNLIREETLTNEFAICYLLFVISFEPRARMSLDSLQFPMAASKEKDTSYCQHRKSNRNGDKDTSCTGAKSIG